jgi:hypothetical protein
VSKPVDETVAERRPLPRLYAHYHRLLIDLLEDLVGDARVVWLTGEEGHIRRPDGQPNTYRKALYVLEDLSPYGKRLAALEAVQAEGHRTMGVKRPGLLLPGTQTGARHVVVSRSEAWSSHALTKEVVVGKLEAFILKTKGNLRAFETYASTHDPRREKVEREIEELEAGLERLKAWDEAVLRERARSDKHTARVLLPDPFTGEEETRLLYVRDVGLIVAGPGLTTRENAIETPTQRKRRTDRMKGRLEPLVRFGAFEVFSEQEWQAAKEV